MSSSGVLLWPGRHILFTRYQERLMRSVLGQTTSALASRLTRPLNGEQPHRIDGVVLAVTSVNQSFSRYNPVPAHVRFVNADRFMAQFGAPYSLFPISTPPTQLESTRFAKWICSSIREESENALLLKPGNAIVVCAEPSLKAAWLALGFSVLDAELSDHELRSHQVLQQMMQSDNVWRALATNTLLHPVSRAVFSENAAVLTRCCRLFTDPILQQSGSLTAATRDYSVYNDAMSNASILALKWADIKDHVVDGLIVDEGCADGALLTVVAEAFPDSDLIGVDLAREMISRAQVRLSAGHFGDSFVHFHQRNLLDPIFAADSVSTTICNSTTHELLSYAGGVGAVERYVALKWNQLRRGGRLLIRDVVGPESAHELVTVLVRSSDGRNPPNAASGDREVATLRGLSTNARFGVFLADFVATAHAGEPAPECLGQEGDFVRWRVSRRLVCEARAHIDYCESWTVEVKEQFCALSFTAWSALLTKHRFVVSALSRAYCSQWLVDNRFAGRFVVEGEGPAAMPTNVVLIAEKRTEQQ
jgi:hypothetical protein